MLNLIEKKAFRRGGGSFRQDLGGGVIVVEDEYIKECKEEKEDN